MGTTEILARHVVETTYDALPSEVVRAAKDVILDGVGVMLAPAQVDEAQTLIETVETLPSLRDLIAVLQGGRGVRP